MHHLGHESPASLPAKVQIVLCRFLAHLDGLRVALDDHVLVHLEPVFDQGEDDAPDPGNLAHGGDVDGVVLAGVDLAADALLHAVDSRGVGGVVVFGMPADPDVAVDAEEDVDLGGAVGGVHGPLLPLGPDNAGAASGARDADEDAVAQLAVAQAAGVQAGGAVLVQLLDLGDDEVALGEEGADLELVGLGALAEDAAGEVDGGDLEGGELRGGDVDAPAAGLDLGDAADDEVAYLGGVAGAEGADGEELVGPGEGAGQGGYDGRAVFGYVRAMTAVFFLHLRLEQ